MSWAIVSTAMMTAVTDIIPAERRGEGMGWFNTSMTLAMATGPLIGIWIADHYAYRPLFVIAAILSAIPLLLIGGMKMPSRVQASVKKIEYFEKAALPVAASTFFLFIAYGGITTFVPLFADAIRINSGTFFLVFAATLALCRPLSGKLSDRYGEAAVIVPAFAISIIALLVLGFSTGLSGVLVSAVLYGIGFGSAQPALHAATIRLARIDRRGSANATLATATDLGIGLGAIVLGWVSQFASYSTLFTVCAVSVAFSVVLFIMLVKGVLADGRPSSD